MDQLRAALHRRLDELAAARPDLGRAVALQRTLLGRQLDLLELIRAGGVPAVALPARYLAAKLARGVPALHGEPIPLPSRVLEMSAREFCAHLAEEGAGEAAAALGRALETRALDPATLISACFGRDQRRVRSIAARQRVSADLAWLVAELAVAPFAHLLQGIALAPGNPAIADALRQWDRGYCPACGSWPAIVETTSGSHVLRCSFCAAGWELSSYRCLYCGNDDETFVTGAPDPDRTDRTVQMCGACGGYVKAIQAGVSVEFPLVAIEDLASMDLDAIAIERKYMRPPLVEIGARGA